MLRRERRFDLACLALLALGVGAFFWPLLAGQWIPKGGGDLVSFLWPMYRFAARSLRRGVVPLWNPYLYSGAPFVADNQSGVFYPVNLAVFLLGGEPSYAAMEALVVFHVWLAGANMFVLARGLGLRRPAALLGGLAFALSDLFVTHLGNLNLNATAAWLPLLLLLTHRALTGGALGWAGGAGAVLAVAALAGHAQMLLFLALTFGLYVAYRLAADYGRGRRRGLRTLARAAFIAVLGMAGAALMLLPAQEMAAHTGRGHLSYDEATRYSLPPQALIGLLAPGFYGRGPANFWGPWDRVEVGYAGVVTLVLAALGVLRRRSSGRERAEGLRLFFALLVPLAFLLALGRHAPLYQVLYRYVPTFDQIRAPARLILLADLGLAGLAAYGLDGLLRGQPRWVIRPAALGALSAGAMTLVAGLIRAARVVPPERFSQARASVVIAALLLALSGALIWVVHRHRRVVWLLPMLLIAELVGLGSTLEAEAADPTRGFRHHDVVAFLKRDPSFFRIEGDAGAWQPDAALVHGLYDIGGIYNPLALAPYEAYRWAMGERGSTLYNLTGAKYALVDKGQVPGDARLVPAYTENSAIDVYENTAVLPRALLIHRSQVVADHAAAWEAIHAPGFDPTRVVVLERGPPLDVEPGPEGGQVTFTHYGLNRVELAVDMPARGFLVLSDVYYPGWRAWVDGAPVEVLRADYVFRAVPLPAGEHTLRMRFRPRTWAVGLAVSLATWAGLGLWAAWRGVRTTREARAADA